MEVYFASSPTTPRGRAAHTIGGQTLVFNKGIYKTSDKSRVVDILASEIYRRGEVKLVSDHDVVNGYLEGNEPDYFNMEVLNKITDDGIRELARIYETKERTRPMIIKAEVTGKEIVDAAVNVMETYKRTAKSEAIKPREFVDAAVEAGKLIKAGVWYKEVDGDFKTKNTDEAYEFLKAKEKG